MLLAIVAASVGIVLGSAIGVTLFLGMIPVALALGVLFFTYLWLVAEYVTPAVLADLRTSKHRN